LEISKNYKYDIVVIGAGASGIASAYAAASSGKTVAIIERASIVGGKATAAYVATICGAHYRSTVQHGKLACGGWPAEFVQRLASLSNTAVIQEQNGIQYLPYNYFDFMRLSEHYLDHPNIDIYLQSTVCKANCTDDKITNLNVFVQDQMITFIADNIVDCSGNALLGDLLDLPLLSSDLYQAGAKVFGVEQVVADDYKVLKLSIYKTVRKGVLEGVLDQKLLHISVVPGSFKNRKLYLKIGLPMEISDQTNLLTALNLQATQLVDQIFTHLKNKLPAFQHAHLGNIPSEVGIRTGKRYKGAYVLEKSEVLDGTKSASSIARAVWPIEYWDYKEKPRMEFFNEDDYYDIPAACLYNKQMQNLYFAGRNISAENEAIASARVIGTCLQTGFAAGLLAASNFLEKERDEQEQIIRDVQKSIEII